MSSNYEIPIWGSRGDQILGKLLDFVSEGEAWLKSQPSSTSFDGVTQILSGSETGGPAVGSSSVGYNKVQRIGRELVASLSNFRHEGEVKALWDTTLYDIAHQLTNLDANWYDKTRAYNAHRAWLQYGVGYGTGYLSQTWDKNFYGPGRGDIRLDAYGPADVTFVQLPKDHNIQNAYITLIRQELPINLAKAIYGQTNAAFAESLTPDRDAPGWLQKGLQKVQQFVAPALRVAGRTQPQQGSFPTVDIFHAYTLDTSINRLSTPIQMGAHGTNWSYMVPALGDPIDTGVRNPATGENWTRAATEGDCRLFPLRRLSIFSRTGICYDGSSPYWHGATPLARVRFNDWAWQANGSSLLMDAKTMQDGIIALMRLIEDAAAARLNPGMLFDDTLVASTFAQSVNPRLAGTRAAAPLQQGEVLKPILPAEYYNTPQGIYDWIRSQEDRMDYLTGVRDLVAMAKANQIPSADTLEKLIEMAGPLVYDMVRALEDPLTQLGNWRISSYFQFYTVPRIIKTVGDDGIPTDVQFTPEKIVPMVTGETAVARTSRAKQMVADFAYSVSQSGISEIVRTQQKLLYLQLQKSGMPISWWTLAQIFQIPNFGPPPEGTNTELERWIAQQRIVADLQADIAANQQADLAAAGAQPTGPTGDEGPGRPQSLQKPPKIVQKDGGTRSTVTTA